MDNYLHTVSSDWYRQRVSGALVFVVAAFLILLARLYYLQIIEGPELRQRSQDNWFRLHSVPPMRGLIFDRNGVLKRSDIGKEPTSKGRGVLDRCTAAVVAPIESAG